MSLEEALGILVREEKKKLIEEFLKDFQWYIAFLTHYHWLSKSCTCRTTPIIVEKWMVKKWQGRLKK